MVDQIVKAYPNDVKFIYKNYPLPFHPNAMPAAKAAIAAGRQGKFWEMHDKIFQDQRSLGPDFYEKAAKEIGLDFSASERSEVLFRERFAVTRPRTPRQEEC